MPKEKCFKECQLLQSVQDMELSAEKLNDGSGIDYTEEYSFNIPFAFSGSSF
jgi:hypothetical protein